MMMECLCYERERKALVIKEIIGVIWGYSVSSLELLLETAGLLL